ncbi:MAG: hypothetical protein AB7F86_10225 [Bdellovibrionales bacterium]
MRLLPSKLVAPTIGVLVMRMGLFLLMPQNAGGLALGAWGVGVLLILTSVAVLVSAILASFIPWKKWWPKRAVWVFSAVCFGLSFGLHLGLVRAGDHDYDLTRKLGVRRIEYFCFHHFYKERCVDVMNACIDCLPLIERWKRETMAKKLRDSAEQSPYPQ